MIWLTFFIGVEYIGCEEEKKKVRRKHLKRSGFLEVNGHVFPSFSCFPVFLFFFFFFLFFFFFFLVLCVQFWLSYASWKYFPYLCVNLTNWVKPNLGHSLLQREKGCEALSSHGQLDNWKRE